MTYSKGDARPIMGEFLDFRPKFARLPDHKSGAVLRMAQRQGRNVLEHVRHTTREVRGFRLQAEDPRVTTATAFRLKPEATQFVGASTWHEHGARSTQHVWHVAPSTRST